jgi:adenylate kinase family enzyme
VIIILEGQNGSGKTTLALKLCKYLNMHYVKEDRFKHPMDESYKTYIDMTLNMKDNCVYDRWHLGEMIYPELKQDSRPGLTVWQQHAIERILMNKGAVLIMCNASESFVKNTYETRGEDFITYDQSAKERTLFNDAFKRSILPKFMYFTDSFNTVKEEATWIKMIMDLADQVNEQMCKIKMFNSSGLMYDHLTDSIRGKKYWPPRYGKVIIVGDAFNKKARNYKPHAFSSAGGCSDYIHKALELTGLPQDIFYLTNSDKSLDILEYEINEVRPVSVIALGENASKRLQLISRGHFALPHPQYFKRFMYRDINKYAYMINLAANGRHCGKLCKIKAQHNNTIVTKEDM